MLFCPRASEHIIKKEISVSGKIKNEWGDELRNQIFLALSTSKWSSYSKKNFQSGEL